MPRDLRWLRVSTPEQHGIVHIPFSIWRPCIPYVELRVPSLGWKVWLFRFIRTVYVFATFPLYVFLLLLGRPMQELHPDWTFFQQLIYPLISRVIWAITWGLLPENYGSNVQELPLLDNWVLSGFEDGHHVAVEQMDIHPTTQFEQEWIKSDAKDPRSLVHPEPLSCFWFWRQQGIKSVARKPFSELKMKEKTAILYFYGGGYVQGHPGSGKRCYSLARKTGLPILGANYRKANSPSAAFPAALQDALLAYSYLLSEGYSIILAGDSAGGGLCMTLLLYLGRNKDQLPKRMKAPIKALLISPWVDLTLSHDSIQRNVELDLLNPTQIEGAAWAYTRLALQDKSTRDGVTKNHWSVIGRSHPLFSPGLSQNAEDLRVITQTEFLIIYGSCDILHDEQEQLAQNLTQAGLKVHCKCYRGEIHDFPFFPSLLPNVNSAMDEMAHFLSI